MKRVLIVIAVLIAIGGGIWWLVNRDTEVATDATGQSTQQSETANAPTPEAETTQETDQSNATSVTIANLSYSPANITIKKGTTVTWTNNDSPEHDIMPDNGSSAAFEASELLAKGESYSFTFNEPGTYTYHCTPHPHMKGTVVVTE